MSLFNGAIRPPAILSDEAVERYLAAVRAEIEMDPLFRRRLRGRVLNHYVAARESGTATTPRRRMGRVGRAVLYATFALAATTTSVLAASQEALPGDMLYPLKRQVERLRAQVLPEQFQDDLAAYELTERIQELGALAERGDTARVAALAVVVQRDYQTVLAASGVVSTFGDAHLAVIAEMLDSLPQPALEAIEKASRHGPDWAPGRASGAPGENSGVGPPATGTNRGGGGSGTHKDDRGSTSAKGADAAPKPSKSPKPTQTPEPAPTLEPTPEPADTPLPEPTPANNGARDGGAGNGSSGGQGSDAQGEDQ